MYCIAAVQCHCQKQCCSLILSFASASGSVKLPALPMAVAVLPAGMLYYMYSRYHLPVAVQHCNITGAGSASAVAADWP